MDDHRRTAADWHGGQGSPLLAFASTGTVKTGLRGEIEHCIDLVEHGRVSSDTDAVTEHDRLRALLHAVEAEEAALDACEIGDEHGQEAAAWWQQNTLGGRASTDTAAFARRVLQGIEDSDPAVLDALPGPAHAGWRDSYTPDQLSEDCSWAEPDPDDTAAHQRWLDAQPHLQDAYEHAFRTAVQDAVAEACRAEPDRNGPKQQTPHRARPADGLSL